METYPFTLDKIVAANIRRLRRQRDRMTREELAGELSSILGRRVSKWRITDLEGGRTRDQVPRPVTWTELVALAQALETTIYDLALPPTEANAGPPFGAEEDGYIPIEVMIMPFGFEFEFTDSDSGASVEAGIPLGRRDLLHSVFRMPEKVLEWIVEDELEKHIPDQHSLEERLETIEKLLREHPDLHRMGLSDEGGERP